MSYKIGINFTIKKQKQVLSKDQVAIIDNYSEMPFLSVLKDNQSSNKKIKNKIIDSNMKGLENHE